MGLSLVLGLGLCAPNVLVKHLDRLIEEGGFPVKYFRTSDGASFDAAAADRLGEGEVSVHLGNGAFHWPAVAVGHVRTVPAEIVGVPITITTVSMTPAVFLVDGLATEQECDVLAQLLKPHLRPATIPSTKSRFMEAMFQLNANATDDSVAILTRLEDRLSRLMRLDEAAASYEKMKAVGLSAGHFIPAFLPGQPVSTSPLAMAGINTVASLELVLNSGYEGGNSLFPNLHGSTSVPYNPMDADPECEADDPRTVAVSKGRLLLHYHSTLDGKVDPLSAKGDCQVTRGGKISVRRSFWSKYTPEMAALDQLHAMQEHAQDLRLSMDEFLFKTALAAFQAGDRNRDGLVVPSEFKPLVEKIIHLVVDTEAVKSIPYPTLFFSVDTDKNKQLTIEEIKDYLFKAMHPSHAVPGEEEDEDDDDDDDDDDDEEEGGPKMTIKHDEL
jgi:hypothetical protein